MARPQTLLYVEDEPETRELIREALAAKYPGLPLYVAANGAEGLSLFREHRPEVVITDIRMPVLNGIAMAKEILAIAPETEVIALTAYSDTTFLTDAIELGFSHYILKPVDYEKLFATVGKSLSTATLKVQVEEQHEQMRRYAQELSRSEAQFRQLAEALPQLIWMVGTDAQALYVNRRWTEYTGADLAATTQGKWLQYVHPEDSERAAMRWAESAATATPYETEYRLRRRDGEYHWFLARGVPLVGESGAVYAWIGSCTDIEDQKRAREAAEATARAKTEFMANMSHEIRTPMNGILGIAELLSGTTLDPLQRQYVDMVRSSGEALLFVVNDILDFSKLEAGAVVLDVVEFDLRDTVEKAVENLAIAAFQKGVELTVEVEPGLPPFFLGDPAKVRQVLLNLVANAVKFTERGEVAVRVAGSEAGERWKLLFSVRDTGIGIPPDKLGIIFDSFTQAESATSRTYGGTGLGLAISKRIVDQMEGRIWAESAPGKGSTFSFEIELQQGAPPARKPTAPSLDITGLRGLVVDDNETARFILERFLLSKGAAVQTCATGEEAIAATFQAVEAGAPFDFILIDLLLPDMDGFEVARRLRDAAPLERVVVMMLTSDDIAGGARRARQEGLAAYLVKPVGGGSLMQALAQLRGAVEEGRGAPEPAPEDLQLPPCTRVLLAEDNPVNLTVTETMLKGAGAFVTTARTGVEAVEACREQTFQVILMDVQMPHMDGLEATRFIRSTGSKVPIVGITAHAMEGDRERFVAAGMDDYLPKPIGRDSLLRKVAYWAKQRLTAASRLDKALAQLEGDGAALDAVVQAFLESVPGQLEEVRAAVAEGDAHRLERAAHLIKGALSVVAADSARCLAQELEETGRSGDVRGASSLLTGLELEVRQVLEELAGRK